MNMKYEIIGQCVPVVEITLDKGETVYTQSGGMCYQSEGIEMNTNTRGGLLKGLGRAFSGESLFMANYTAISNQAMIAFATTVPGTILPIDLRTRPQGLIIQKGSFLCAEDDVTTQVSFTKKFGAGLFGGEGFILQKAEGKDKGIDVGIKNKKGNNRIDRCNSYFVIKKDFFVFWVYI
mgnify:CR=1 FL=1